jgi:hypothetical protein
MQYSIDDRSVLLSPLLGMGTELAFSEYFRVGLGIHYERRGGKIEGGYDYEWEFRYSYLQFPFWIKGVVPLLIPGSVFLKGGAEVGANLSAEVKETHPSDTYYESWVDRTAPVDFGFVLALGYEFPLGATTGFSVYAASYLGVVDVHREEGNEPSIELSTRSLRIGVSVYSLLIPHGT